MKTIIKGNIIYTPSKDVIKTVNNGFLLANDGIIEGVYDTLPKDVLLPKSRAVAENDVVFYDFTDRLIIPGLNDLHLHAPQFAFRGLGMDMELLPWLENYAFKEEEKYADMAYAQKAYRLFANALIKSPTTRAVIFATIHSEATELLMEILEKTGMAGYVGKVNMDKNCAKSLLENTEESLLATEKWIANFKGKSVNFKPIITPRFVPTCSSLLLNGLGELAVKYNVPVQSHLSENTGEISFVKELYPDIACYGAVYDKFGLMGKSADGNIDVPTIMAHCVYLVPKESELIKRNKVFVAHCPASNTNIGSGIAPVRKMLDQDILVGLGTDVAGGFSISMFRAMSDAVQVSKLKWLYSEKTENFLTLSEVLYMGTKLSGSFFGKVGSFEPGFELDAIVLDDDNLGDNSYLSLEQRLERTIYLADDRNIISKFVSGRKV